MWAHHYLKHKNHNDFLLYPHCIHFVLSLTFLFSFRTFKSQPLSTSLSSSLLRINKFDIDFNCSQCIVGLDNLGSPFNHAQLCPAIYVNTKLLQSEVSVKRQVCSILSLDHTDSETSSSSGQESSIKVNRSLHELASNKEKSYKQSNNKFKKRYSLGLTTGFAELAGLFTKNNSVKCCKNVSLYTFFVNTYSNVS